MQGAGHGNGYQQTEDLPPLHVRASQGELLCSSQGGEGFVSNTCCVLAPRRNSISLKIIKLIVLPGVANAGPTGQTLVKGSWSKQKTSYELE